MNGYTAFLRKEFCEQLRTFRLLILAAVFLLFGMMSPLTAKLTPKLLESLMTEGITIQITEPTALDSWAQFFKNIGQTGIIILVILYSGTLSHEYSRGTLVNMLTKGLSRPAVILSKFTAAAVLWTAAYLLSFTTTWIYTWYFWRTDTVPHMLPAVGGLWVFGLFLLAALMLGGSLFRTGYGNLLFTGGIAAVGLFLQITPKLERWNPMTLTGGLSLMNGSMEPSVMYTAAAVSGILTTAMLAAAIARFNRAAVV